MTIITTIEKPTITIDQETGVITVNEESPSVIEVALQGEQGIGFSDGDKGDFTVSNNGQTATINTSAVTSAKILDGTIVNADINASASIQGTKISPDFGSQNIVTTGTFSSGDQTITGATPKIHFVESDDNPDYKLFVFQGMFGIKDATNNVDRLNIQADGHIDIAGNLDVGAGIDVLGGGITTTSGSIIANVGTNNQVKIGDDGAIEISRNNGGAFIDFKSDTSEDHDARIQENNGGFDLSGNVNIANGLDVTGLITTNDLKIGDISPVLVFQDTNADADNQKWDFKCGGSNTFVIQGINDAGGGGGNLFKITRSGNSLSTFEALKSGVTWFTVDNVNRKVTTRDLDVTNNITVTGTVDTVDIAARDTLFGALTSSSGVLTDGVTGTTQSASDNSTKIATTAYTDTAIANLVSSAPSTLDTLGEIATALNNDAALNTTLTNSIATKLPLAGGTLTGDLTIDKNNPVITFSDNNNNPDYQVGNINGVLRFQDTTNNATRLQINTDGHIDLNSNVDISGLLTVTNDLILTDQNPSLFFTETGNVDPDYKIFLNQGIFKIIDETNTADRFVINTDGHIDFPTNVDFASGIDVTGAITATASAANTDILTLTTHNSRNLVFTTPNGDSGTLPFVINTGNAIEFKVDNSRAILLDKDTAVHLHHDGSSTAKLSTTANGVTVDGSITVSGAVAELILTETDTTTSGRVVTSFGQLYMQAGATGSGTSGSGTINLTGYGNVNASEIVCKTNLFNINGNLKVDTDTLFVDSTNDRVGINQASPSFDLDVVGMMRSYAASGGLGTSGLRIGTATEAADIYFSSGSANAQFNITYGGSGGNDIAITHDGAVKLSYGGSTTPKLATTATGVNVEGTATISNIGNNQGLNLDGANNNTCLHFTSTGSSPAHGFRIAFHSPTNSRFGSPALLFDKINNSTRAFDSHIAGISDDGFHLDDNKKLHLGSQSATGDLQIYHNGVNSWIVDQGTGHLVIGSNGDKVRIAKGSGAESMAEFKTDGAVELYYDGGTYSTPKLSTTASGVVVNGELDINSTSYARTMYQASGTDTWSVGLRDSAGGDTNYHIFRETGHTGEVEINAKVNANSGLDVSGSINSTGNIEIEAGTLIIDTNPDSPSTSFGLQEAIRIDDAGIAGNPDRNFSIYEYRQGGGRFFSLNMNLTSGSTGSAYTYTQGNWGGSSMMQFNNGATRFYADAQVTGGSNDVITPTERFKIDTSGVNVTGSLAVNGTISENGVTITSKATALSLVFS